jgi:hypothetical protein
VNRTFPLARLSCALLTILLLAHCQGRAPSTAEKQLPAASLATPPEIQQVAETLLGSEAEVLAFGDLARNGQQQVLVINRLKGMPGGNVPGILLTRAVIAEKDGARWTEVLGCDEHLKNSHGYLAAAPIAPVSAWHLKYELQNAGEGLVLYFTPLAQPAGSALATIGVRWNSRLERYQSLDRTQQHFLGETPTLETPQVRLRG